MTHDPCSARAGRRAEPTASNRQGAAAAGGVALLIIDMINALDFPEAGGMRDAAIAAARAVARLRLQAEEAGVPVIYVNDNDGEWHSERSRLIERCLADDSAGAAMVRTIEPHDDDYFVIKPRFSGFYATNLPVLLPQLGVTRLILTGIAADICVLFTAADAHMREYELWVPRDAVAATDAERTDWALDIMANSMGAETAPSGDLALADWFKRV